MSKKVSVWKKIGTNIKNVREWRGLTDLQASKSLGVELERYQKMESGQTQNMTFKELMNIKKLFNVYIEEILPI